jgi:ADP-heptose:LPS heptosyltransferase
MKYFATKDSLDMFGFENSSIFSRKKNDYDLVIVKDDGIGDYCLWIDALRAYKKVFSEKKVLFLCSAPVSSLAKKEPFFTEVETISEKGLYTIKGFLSFRRRFHKIKAELCIYPCWSRHIGGELATFFICSKKKVGMKRNPKDFRFWWHYPVSWLFNLSYNRLVKYEDTDSEMLSIESFTKQVVDSEFKYGEDLSKYIFEKSMVEGKYVVVALSSSKDYKVWPPERFAAVIDTIPHGMNIVLTGYGEKDEQRSNTILQRVNDPTRIINKVNKTSLVDLFSLIAESQLVIGNDSAAVHMAAINCVPSVCIFPLPGFGRFLPYPVIFPENFRPRIVYSLMNCGDCHFSCHRMINGICECVDRITVNMVKKELSSVLTSYKERNERKD